MACPDTDGQHPTPTEQMSTEMKPEETEATPAREDDLARDMACFLWECSRIRHGLFTPPEFIPLVSARLREYFKNNRTNEH